MIILNLKKENNFFVTEDIEDDFPTICVNPSAVRLSPVTVAVKDEPLSDPDSPASSCPTSPLPENFKEAHQEIDIEMDTDTVSLIINLIKIIN